MHSKKSISVEWVQWMCAIDANARESGQKDRQKQKPDSVVNGTTFGKLFTSISILTASRQCSNNTTPMQACTRYATEEYLTEK